MIPQSISTRFTDAPHSADTVRLAEQLLRDGFLILENHMGDELLQRVYRELDPHFGAAAFGTGPFFGGETKRFGRVLSRSAASAELVMDSTIIDLVGHLLSPHCSSVQLNLTQGIEIHPGAPAQGPHRDQDMWPGAAPGVEYMVNVMWALDDFTVENGATRIWPGSNHQLDVPLMPEEEAKPAAMPAGSVCLFLGTTLHSGGANRSARPRRGFLASYALGWLRTWENQFLAYPPHVARSFSPELAELVGYSQHKPSLGNFEGQCPSVLLQDEDWAPFVDALLPEQLEMAAQYRSMQLELMVS
jgi:ectoine hydroxylase-related dioxygenase (phytanoyl-CoA dioxygenase family)